MSLPVLTAPKHTTELPVCKQEITFRPFLVKEEKIMIIAEGSDDSRQIENAVSQVIDNCTFGKVDADDLCQADLEWLILQIRGHSKGFEVELVFECQNEIPVIDEEGNKHPSDKKPCLMKNEIKGDLRTVSVIGGNESNLIDLGGGLGMKMKSPTIGVLKAIEKADENEVESSFSHIMACIESIYNEDEVWLGRELSRKELSDFIDSFSDAQFQEIKKWTDNEPTLKLAVDYQCQRCGAKDKITIEGIDNFFG